MSGLTERIAKSWNWSTRAARFVRSARRARPAARKTCALILIFLLAVTPLTVHAAPLPVGGEIRYGDGAIGTSVDRTVTVTQTSERMVIGWLGVTTEPLPVRFGEPPGA